MAKIYSNIVKEDTILPIGSPSADFIPSPKVVAGTLNTADIVNVDLTFIAGESITVNQAVGFYGEIDEEGTAASFTAATYVKQDDAAANFDGLGSIIPRNYNAGAGHWDALIKFNLADDLPTGSTLLSTRIYLYGEDGGGGGTHAIHANEAAFTEGTVTWNTKPAYTAGSFSAVTAAAGWVNSGWLTGITTGSNYTNLIAYGATIYSTLANSGSWTVSDEDDAEKGYIQRRYSIRDGKVYKVNSSLATYANSFIGIALNSAVTGEPIKVRIEGKVRGYEDLSPYQTYYLTTVDGAISSTAAGTTKIIGKALSSSELQVKNIITT